MSALEVSGSSPTEDVASGLRRGTSLEHLSLRNGVKLLAGPDLLLLDDLCRIGWTMMKSADSRCRADVTAVLLFVVHQRP